MKPCSKWRKKIVWLALDALDGQKAFAVREHLLRCAGCHSYWEEISNVAVTLQSAPQHPHFEASEFFHHRLTEKLRTLESRSGLENLAAWCGASILNWRVVLPATAALAIGLAAILIPRHPRVDSSPPTSTSQAVWQSDSGKDFAPTLANYQMIASQSLEKFDEVLARRGNQRLPPAPVYTVSSVRLADSSF